MEPVNSSDLNYGKPDDLKSDRRGRSRLQIVKFAKTPFDFKMNHRDTAVT